MKNGACPKCGSNKIMADVTVMDVGNSGPYPLRVEIEEPEPAERSFLWTPRSATGNIRAWICCQCGFTELYTNNLEELYNIYKLGK